MMPVSTLLSPQRWAEATFGSVELGDPRRRRRALSIAQALATDPGATLPKQMHGVADLEATYRFLQSPAVNYEHLIRPHLQATQQQCREQSEVLLTSVPTQTAQDAQERVDWYRARWIVEDYHQGLKTGCQIEHRHMQTYEGLRTVLGLLAPLAVRLLQLRASARQFPERPASQVLPIEVVQVVAHLAQLPVEQLNTQSCWHTIARYGGYLGRKSDGPPGWKTLWRGWVYVQTLLEGVHLASLLSSEQLNL